MTSGSNCDAKAVTRGGFVRVVLGARHKSDATRDM